MPFAPFSYEITMPGLQGFRIGALVCKVWEARMMIEAVLPFRPRPRPSAEQQVAARATPAVPSLR